MNPEGKARLHVIDLSKAVEVGALDFSEDLGPTSVTDVFMDGSFAYLVGERLKPHSGQEEFERYLCPCKV